MDEQQTANFIEVNKNSWNKRTDAHWESAFYDVPGFLDGKNSLNDVELTLLGDVSGKKILHLQCHFGQDSISLARMGADITGVDLSDNAISRANELSSLAQIKATFICCNIYDLPNFLDEQFDIVFTSYGTIGWLPDLNQWATLIARYLKPGGQFIMAEFHPVVWMFDNHFKEIQYNYFKAEAIEETESGTYADKNAPITISSITWNHSSSEVINSLLQHGLELNVFNEYDYSPYDCFNETIEVEPKKFRIKHLGNKIPMLFSIRATKK